MDEMRKHVATQVRVVVKEKSKSKCPGARVCLVQLRNHKEMNVAGAKKQGQEGRG